MNVIPVIQFGFFSLESVMNFISCFLTSFSSLTLLRSRLNMQCIHVTWGAFYEINLL